MFSAILAFFAGLLGKVLGWIITPKNNPAQRAVNTETKMAQDVADTPDTERTEKELNSGSF